MPEEALTFEAYCSFEAHAHQVMSQIPCYKYTLRFDAFNN